MNGVLKTEEKAIGNNTYIVTALGALKGREVFVRMVKMLGGAVDSLDKNNLGEALTKLADRLDEKDLNYLCDILAKNTDVRLPDGRAPRLADVFDLHFSANYLDMLAWLVFALTVNFESFFRGLAAKRAKGGSATPPEKTAEVPSA